MENSKVNLYDYADFREFLIAYIKNLPKQGHGFKLKIAEELNVHPTLITQILKGQRTFTAEQAYGLVLFLNLNDLEKDYFLNLVELDKAGTHSLKKFIEAKLKKLKSESEKIKNRVESYTALDEADQAIFYSQWFFSAIRLSCGLKQKITQDFLVNKFNLSDDLVAKVLDFLLKKGLIKQNKDQTYVVGPQNTFLPSDSPLISRHHMNWRMKATERHAKLNQHELAFTGPVSVSKKDLLVIRKMCLSFIQDVSKVVKESPEETLACINLDWFEIE